METHTRKALNELQSEDRDQSILKPAMPSSFFKHLYRNIVPKRIKRIFHPILHPLLTLVESEIRRCTRDEIFSGPFARMKIGGVSLSPGMKLGVYELELHEALSVLRQRRFTQIIDIGAAEGYYANGVLLWHSDSEVTAYEANSIWHNSIISIARENSFESRIRILGECSLEILEQKLKSIGSAIEETLLIVDVEGFEKTLLDPKLVPQLTQAVVVVEVHDNFVPECARTIRERFDETHTIQSFSSRERDIAEYPIPSGLKNFGIMRLAIERTMSDGRTVPNGWFIMVPKSITLVSSNSQLADESNKIDAKHLLNVAFSHKPVCRILLVYDTLGVGGAETWLVAILKYLWKNSEALSVRPQIDVLLTGGRPGHFDAIATSYGARLFYVAYSRKQLIKFALKFRTILKQGNYDVIHDQQDYAAGIHLFLGLGRLPKRRIVHVHNPYDSIKFLSNTKAREFIYKLGKRLLLRNCSQLLGTSRQILKEYGFDEPEFSHIGKDSAHCGFDVADFLGDRSKVHAELAKEFGWSSDVKIILFVGRLSSNYNQKNPRQALLVARECIKRDPTVRLLIAGGGDSVVQDLRAEVESWNLSNEILLINERSDIPRLMIGANLFLFPSISEGLGMVAVEAQAAGLPVLASSTVPQEIVVVPDLVTFLSLNQSIEVWAEHALSILDAKPLDSTHCNSEVDKSGFSIKNSVAKLLHYYTC